MSADNKWAKRWKIASKTLRHALYWRRKEIEREVRADERTKALNEAIEVACVYARCCGVNGKWDEREGARSVANEITRLRDCGSK